MRSLVVTAALALGCHRPCPTTSCPPAATLVFEVPRPTRLDPAVTSSLVVCRPATCAKIDVVYAAPLDAFAYACNGVSGEVRVACRFVVKNDSVEVIVDVDGGTHGPSERMDVTLDLFGTVTHRAFDVTYPVRPDDDDLCPVCAASYVAPA